MVPNLPSSPSVNKSTTIDCGELSSRQINQAVKAALAVGTTRVHLKNPAGRHNLVVGLPGGVVISCDGPVGRFAAGLNAGAAVKIHGSAGGGAAEGMSEGSVVIEGDAGQAVAAAARGGTIVVRGNASNRAGTLLQGGVLLVGGNLGLWGALGMVRGLIVVCGDAAQGIGQDMQGGAIFVGGDIGHLGRGATIGDPTDDELRTLQDLLRRWSLPPVAALRKLIPPAAAASGRNSLAGAGNPNPLGLGSTHFGMLGPNNSGFVPRGLLTNLPSTVSASVSAATPAPATPASATPSPTTSSSSAAQAQANFFPGGGS